MTLGAGPLFDGSFCDADVTGPESPWRAGTETRRRPAGPWGRVAWRLGSMFSGLCQVQFVE